jgi:hypothetical protein
MRTKNINFFSECVIQVCDKLCGTMLQVICLLTYYAHTRRNVCGPNISRDNVRFVTVFSHRSAPARRSDLGSIKRRH